MDPPRQIVIEPPSDDYYNGKLFDPEDPILNRDDYLRPYRHFKEYYESKGCDVRLADQLPDEQNRTILEYYSFGITRNIQSLSKRSDIRMKAFVVFEPPVVAPDIYDSLPQITKNFENVYVHNTEGNGYSMDGVDTSRLRKLYWPQQYADVLDSWSSPDRLRKFVLVNNNKIPNRFEQELYSHRIRAAAALSKKGAIDLYGSGWNRLLHAGGLLRRGIYWPSMQNHRWLRKAHRGAPESKFEVLARYDLCLCIENMRMEGYMTEKMFDCLYTGTVPYYLGPPDVHDYVPSSVFVDLTQFNDWGEAWEHARSLDQSQIQEYREAGREFIQGPKSDRFKQSLIDILA